MQGLSSARLNALTLIGQAPPIGLEVVDLWSSGWCRLHVKAPQGVPRITAAAYEWLKDQGLVQEARYGRPMTAGRERNRRYVTLTDAGRARLADRKANTRSE